MGLNEKNNENNGFTLIELVVVIGILSILSSISLVYFNGLIEELERSQLKTLCLRLKKNAKRIMRIPYLYFLRIKGYKNMQSYLTVKIVAMEIQ